METLHCAFRLIDGAQRSLHTVAKQPMNGCLATWYVINYLEKRGKVCQ